MKSKTIITAISLFILLLPCIVRCEPATKNDLQSLISDFDGELSKISRIKSSDKNQMAKAKALEEVNKKLNLYAEEILKYDRKEIESTIREYMKVEWEKIEQLYEIYSNSNKYRKEKDGGYYDLRKPLPPNVDTLFNMITKQQDLIKELLAIYFQPVKDKYENDLFNKYNITDTFRGYLFDYEFVRPLSRSEFTSQKREAMYAGELFELKIPKSPQNDPFMGVVFIYDKWNLRYEREDTEWKLANIRLNSYIPELIERLLGSGLVELIERNKLNSRFKSIEFSENRDSAHIRHMKPYKREFVHGSEEGLIETVTYVKKLSDDEWKIDDVIELNKSITKTYNELDEQFSSSKDSSTTGSHTTLFNSERQAIDSRRVLADRVVSFIVNRSSTFRNATFKGTENRGSEMSYNYDVEYVVGNGSLKVGTFNVAIQNGKCREVYFNGRELWEQVMDPKLAGYKNPPD